MSNKSDIFKALKRAGYKQVSSNKHLLYQNDQGYQIRAHLGSNISSGLLRNILQEIRSGSTRANSKH